MRQIIDKFLSEHSDCYLLVADFGKFPLMEKTNRYINVLLSENLMVNIAIGLAATGKKVFIYSAAGFTLYRAFDTIKHNIVEKTHVANSNELNITFLNAGSGFIYSKFGITHYLFDDMAILNNIFKNIKTYIPYNSNTTLGMLQKTYNINEISYIRLCPDSIDDIQIINKTETAALNIYTCGWLVSKIQSLLIQHNINANIKCITSSDFIVNDKNSVIVYDCTKFDNNYDIPTLCIDNFTDDYSSNVQIDVLKYYHFDDSSILEFIKKHI